jgi:hypothetical protein
MVLWNSLCTQKSGSYPVKSIGGNYHAREVLCETVTGYPTNGEKEVKV